MIQSAPCLRMEYCMLHVRWPRDYCQSIVAMLCVDKLKVCEYKISLEERFPRVWVQPMRELPSPFPQAFVWWWEWGTGNTKCISNAFANMEHGTYIYTHNSNITKYYVLAPDALRIFYMCPMHCVYCKSSRHTQWWPHQGHHGRHSSRKPFTVCVSHIHTHTPPAQSTELTFEQSARPPTAVFVRFALAHV